METDEEWVEDLAMSPQLKAKLLALKVCRNRSLAHASSDTALDIARPVLKMFTTLLQYSGSFTAEAPDDPQTKARLRLQAAVSLLHLASIGNYAPEIATNFVLLAVTVQDPCYQVRMTFMDKLVALLTARKIPPQYNVIPFLSVHDPEADVKNKAKAYIVTALRSMPKVVRLNHFEIIFIRLLHLLAHHPDFVVNEENLPDIAKYIEFYLELVASAENISLLYHLAMKAKTVRDAESHTYSENLYAASELAQHLIKNCAKLHSWSLESYPGKVRLPGDILRPLPNAEAANEILKTIYLPENTLGWLTEQHKERKAQEPKQDKPRTDRKTSGKRKAAPKTNGAAKRSRTTAKRWKATDSDEDEESSPSESSDEDDEPRSARPSNGSEVEEADGHSEPEEKEEKLGRGARTRAKARIKQQIKKPVKRKAKAAASDD